MSVTVLHADAREALRDMDAATFDACVTDPPYALVSIARRFGAENAAPAAAGVYARAAAGFMGKRWDTGECAFDPAFWAEVLRVLNPGAHLVAFGGTRTYHRLVCAIEDAGFEIRDQLAWLFGSGFPKSHDVSRGLDKALGVAGERGEYKTPAHAIKRKPGNERMHEGYQRPWRDDADASDANMRAYLPGSDAAKQWQGWGTALKPAHEPIVLARKPLIGTIAANALQYGTGALNINACRVAYESADDAAAAAAAVQRSRQSPNRSFAGWDMAQHNLTPEDYAAGSSGLGRWPANLVHDGSEGVLRLFPDTDGQQRAVGPEHGEKSSVNTFGDYGPRNKFAPRQDSGSAARFFYNAKADADDRLGSKHPTVKPVDLMAWLVKLVTPPGGRVLDPFAGSGPTGMACMREGFHCTLIEREAEYVDDIKRRVAHVSGADTPLFAP